MDHKIESDGDPGLPKKKKNSKCDRLGSSDIEDTHYTGFPVKLGIT